jgi:hypothetical protein
MYDDATRGKPPKACVQDQVLQNCMHCAEVTGYEQPSIAEPTAQVSHQASLHSLNG